jgi:carbamoyltransferase
MKNSYILGLHIGHDATAALINNKGEIIAAIAEERMTRVKYHTGFPYESIEEVIRVAGATKAEVTAVAFSTEHMLFPNNKEYNDIFFLRNPDEINKYDIFNNPNQLLGKWGRLIGLIPGLRPATLSKEEQAKQSRELSLNREKEVLAQIGLGHAEVVSFNHHRCHAASAYYTSGKQKALIITMDGAGDGDCATASVIENGKIKIVSRANSEVSPGRFYSEITGFCGFKRLRHEGKITGLAAYGNPDKYYKQLKQFIRFNPQTEQFEYNSDNKTGLSRKWATLQRILKNRFTSPLHVAEFYDFLDANFDPKKDMADLSATAQKLLEELGVEYTKHFLNKYPNENVLLAGGVFANVRVNQEIAEIPGVKFIFVHQNMGDGGLSGGAAFLYHYEYKNNRYNGYAPSNVYFGPEYSDAEIEAELKKNNISFAKLDDIETECARLIYEGKVIGRFNGRMEYGPRALGNRTIMARPTDKNINDWLNKKLKRTEFMPFAPSMIIEEAHNVLENYENGPSKYADNFMTITYDVKPEWQEKTQATTHVDGTARPQVVTAEANPSYHKIIAEYFKLSGIPVIINTSFNMHEEPIVTTPNDAIRSFEQGCLDYLAIGNYLCEYKK